MRTGCFWRAEGKKEWAGLEAFGSRFSLLVLGIGSSFPPFLGDVFALHFYYICTLIWNLDLLFLSLVNIVIYTKQNTLGVPWWLSGLRFWGCHYCGKGSIWFLAWELSHATGMAKKKRKKKLSLLEKLRWDEGLVPNRLCLLYISNVSLLPLGQSLKIRTCRLQWLKKGSWCCQQLCSSPLRKGSSSRKGGTSPLMNWCSIGCVLESFRDLKVMRSESNYP